MKLVGLYAFEEMKTGGHKRYVELLYQILEKDHQLIVIAPQLVGPLKQYSNDNKLIFIKIKSINSKMGIPFSAVFFFNILISLNKLNHRLEGANAVVVFGITNLWSALLLKHKFKLPILFGLRSNIFYNKLLKKNKNLFKKIYYNLRYYLIKKATQKLESIIVQNPSEKKLLNDEFGIKNNKISVIQNNLNASWLTEMNHNFNKSDSLNKIVFVGTLSKRKNIELILDLIDYLFNRNELRFEFYIAGKGPLLNKIKTFLDKKEYKDKIHLLGFVEDVPGLLKKMDLTLVPSLVDPCPNVILESLYMRTPVIGSDITGIKNLLVYDDLLFDNKDVCNLYKTIIRIEKNYKYFKNLCLNRRNKLQFDWGELFIDEIKKIKK